MALKTELTNDDELDSGVAAATELADSDDEAAGVAQETGVKRGPLLDLGDAEAARRVLAMRKLHERTRSRRAAEAQRIAYWRRGYRYVQLSGDEDRGTWKATLPVGSSKLPPSPNKVDRLIRRIVSVVTHDPPVPSCIPASDDDRAIAAAEFSERVLKAEGSSSGLNLPRLLRRAMDKSANTKSTFPFFYVDPSGGGHRAKSMFAHPQATHMDNATQDPMTGTDVANEDDLTERYVAPDGSLTDNELEADRQWLPRVKWRLLTPQHVDLIPDTADSIEDAVGVTITMHMTLGELKSLAPDWFAEATPSDINAMVTGCKPQDWKAYLPRELRMDWHEPVLGKNDGTYGDDAILFPTLTFYKAHPEYPEGARVITVGDRFRPLAEPWYEEIENDDGTVTCEYLELPLAQCRSLDDDVEDDNMGTAIGEKLGPMDEIRAQILGNALDYLFRFGNPQVYLPIGTTVQPKQLQFRTGDPIYTPVGQQPFYEQPPEWPREIAALNAEMSAEMDDESNLQQAAQGVEDPSVQSGVHAATIVEQSNIALSQIRENASDCYKRCCRVVLQLIRCFYDVEQQLEYQGVDGEWRREAWVGSDLGSTKLVEIQRGSFSMLAPSQKQANATNWLQLGIISKDQFDEMMATSIAPTLGLTDSPQRKRVMGQLERWRKGPTPADQEAFQVYTEQQQLLQAKEQQDAALAQQQAAATGQPQMMPQEPQLPPLVLPGDPFATDQRPSDQEQDAAIVRHAAIRRVMDASAFGSQPKFWQDVLTAEYERMRTAAGVMTVQEQQQAQMQAEQLKLQIAQTPKVSVIDKSANAETIGQDVAATQAAFHGGAAA